MATIDLTNGEVPSDSWYNNGIVDSWLFREFREVLRAALIPNNLEIYEKIAEAEVLKIIDFTDLNKFQYRIAFDVIEEYFETHAPENHRERELRVYWCELARGLMMADERYRTGL